MATFSVNQVRHVYVSKSFKSAKLTNSSNEGDLAVTAVKGPDKTNTGFVIQSMGKGGLTRSPLIELDKIVSVTNTLAASMAHNVKRAKLELKSTVINSTKIADAFTGKDFIVRINFSQYVGISDEETMVKHGCVRTYTGQTVAEFYKVLALSLANNMSREIQPLVKVFAGTVEVNAGMKLADITGTPAYIAIEEVEQPWQLGVIPETFVNFTITPATVDVMGAEVEVFDVKDDTSSSKQFGNGKRVADLEYFAMGDRGDLYRNIGWPYSIPSKTFLDGSGTYDLVDITFYWNGPNEDVQKSQKQVTIIASAGGGAAIKTAIDAIIKPAATSTGS